MEDKFVIKSTQTRPRSYGRERKFAQTKSIWPDTLLIHVPAYLARTKQRGKSWRKRTRRKRTREWLQGCLPSTLSECAGEHEQDICLSGVQRTAGLVMRVWVMIPSQKRTWTLGARSLIAPKRALIQIQSSKNTERLLNRLPRLIPWLAKRTRQIRSFRS